MKQTYGVGLHKYKYLYVCAVLFGGSTFLFWEFACETKVISRNSGHSFHQHYRLRRWSSTLFQPQYIFYIYSYAILGHTLYFFINKVDTPMDRLNFSRAACDLFNNGPERHQTNFHKIKALKPEPNFNYLALDPSLFHHLVGKVFQHHSFNF